MAKEKIKQLLDLLTDDDVEILEDAFYISKEVAKENIIHYNKLKEDGKGFYGIEADIKKHEYNYAKCNLVLAMFYQNKNNEPINKKNEKRRFKK